MFLPGDFIPGSDELINGGLIGGIPKISDMKGNIHIADL